MKIFIKLKRILRKRLKVTFCSTVFVCVFFLCYQYFYSTQLHSINLSGKRTVKRMLTREIVPEKKFAEVLSHNLPPKRYPYYVRGVHEKDTRYKPDESNSFICFASGDKISFDKVNDDYCDCEHDGSDEPGTNACINGVFFCSTEGSYRDLRAIPTYQVNDGICDCCDGSDEWKGKQLTSGLSGADLVKPEPDLVKPEPDL